MTRRIQVLFFSLIIVFSNCNTSHNNEISKEDNTTVEANVQIPNGIYLILNEYEDSTDIKTTNMIVPFSFDFLDSNTNEQPILLEIDTTEYVALDLAEKPNGIEQKDKRINLMLTLTGAASSQLTDFTEKHIKRHVAIVIGGKAMTKHKIRERIEGGRLQITRCTDNACKYLLVELRENYKE